MVPSWRTVWKTAAFLLAVGALAVAMTVWVTLPSNRVICQWGQPPDIAYDGFGPYTLAVVEGGREWSNPGWERRHQIFVGRGEGAPSYGYWCDFTFHAAGERADQCIKQSAVEWTADGVTFAD